MLSRKIVGCSLSLRRVWGWSIVVCIFVLCQFSPISAQPANFPQEFFRFLQDEMDLSKGEINGLKQGRIITKQVDTDVKHEVVIVSVTRLNVPGEFFVQHYGEGNLSFELVKAEAWRMFSTPPTIDEVREISLTSVDLEELGRCKDGECKLKAPASLIEAFAPIDKTAPDVQEQIDAALQQAVVGFAQDYLQNGGTGMIEYRDQKAPTRVADEFQDILKLSPYLNVYMPVLKEYLEEFPAKPLDSAKSDMYWLIENFGGKAKRLTLSVNHMVFYQPKADELIVAATQLYAMHYYEAALGLTVMVKDLETSEPGFYLMHINRSRIDVLRRVPRFLAKDLFDGAQDLVDEKMTLIKEKMEELYQTK